MLYVYLQGTKCYENTGLMSVSPPRPRSLRSESNDHILCILLSHTPVSGAQDKSLAYEGNFP